MFTMASLQLWAIGLAFLASLTLSSSASLEGVPPQEVFSDAGSAYWAHAPVHVRRSVQYCGTRLVDAIRNLCKGNTYAPLSRRSDPTLTSLGAFDSDIHDLNSNSVDFSDSGDYWDSDSSANDFELTSPHNGKSWAFKIFTENGAHQRFRRTIIDECCKKPCTALEMVKYCGSPRRAGSG